MVIAVGLNGFRTIWQIYGGCAYTYRSISKFWGPCTERAHDLLCPAPDPLLAPSCTFPPVYPSLDCLQGLQLPAVTPTHTTYTPFPQLLHWVVPVAGSATALATQSTVDVYHPGTAGLHMQPGGWVIEHLQVDKGMVCTQASRKAYGRGLAAVDPDRRPGLWQLLYLRICWFCPWVNDCQLW